MLCCASLSSKSAISTVSGMSSLRNNSVALNQLCRVAPANGETKIPGYEIPTPDEIGSEKPFDQIPVNIHIAPTEAALFHIAHYWGVA